MTDETIALTSKQEIPTNSEFDSNLVARLRDVGRARGVELYHTLASEAADALAEQAETIERLKAALQEIARADPSPTQLEIWCNWVHSKVREALRDDPASPVSR